MFSMFGKNVGKRMLSDHLQEFGLSTADLSPAVLKQLLDVLHRQANVVARKYHEPVAHILENMVSSATWGIAYSLLGPTRLLQIHPGYKDMAEEIEIELLASERGYPIENSIYQQVFVILSETTDCHPEVRDLLNRVRSNVTNIGQRSSSPGFLSMH